MTGDDVLAAMNEAMNACIGTGLPYTACVIEDGMTLISSQAAEIARLTAEVERLRALTTWRPISEAPKDGTPVLVYAPKYQDLSAIICSAAYHEDGGWCVDELRFVTSWMPLPPAPSDEA